MLETTGEDIRLNRTRKFSGLVNQQGLILYEMMLKSIPNIAYDITSTYRGLNVEDLDYYIKNGFEYAIISHDVVSTLRSQKNRKLYPKSNAFYNEVQKELTLLKTISPGKFNSGDTFYVYSFRDIIS